MFIFSFYVFILMYSDFPDFFKAPGNLGKVPDFRL